MIFEVLSLVIVTVGFIGGEPAEEFLRDRRRKECRIGLSPCATAPLLRYLRGLRAMPPVVAPVPVTPEVLLGNYRDYLTGERGVSSGTATHYLRCARVFLESLPGQMEVTLAE